MAAHVLVLTIDVHVPQAHSLKDKRAVVKTILEGARRRFGVSAAETEHQDKWQRAGLGFAAVASSRAMATETIDKLERFVWSFPEVEVLEHQRTWAELD